LNPRYSGIDKIFTASRSTPSSILRLDGFPRSPWTTALSPRFFHGGQQPLNLPNAQSQLLARLTLCDQLLSGFLQRHQPVSIGLGHQ
jgi:hypothetical protein